MSVKKILTVCASQLRPLLNFSISRVDEAIADTDLDEMKNSTDQIVRNLATIAEAEED